MVLPALLLHLQTPSGQKKQAARSVFSLWVVYIFIYLAFLGSLKFVSITETGMVERDRREVAFVREGKTTVSALLNRAWC